MFALLCRLVFFGATARIGALVGGKVVGFGGPGAIATTVLAGFSVVPELVGVFAAVPAPADPAVEFGDSESFPDALPEVGVVAGVCATEFFRLAPFLDLDEPLTTALPLPRLRFLITSVFKLSGLTTPCSFKNSPQALHKG